MKCWLKKGFTRVKIRLENLNLIHTNVKVDSWLESWTWFVRSVKGKIRMDLVNIVQSYILKILEEAGPGMKVCF